jgi:hypothetical protein
MSNLISIREELSRYEDKIINKCIESSKNRTEWDIIDIDGIVESMDFNMENKYHFILNDIIYYYYDNNRIEGNTELEKELFILITNRILLGKEVIKNKILLDKDKYSELIDKQDMDSISSLLENKEVENKIISRLINKEIHGYTSEIKMKVVSLYKDFIIPYTKRVQLVYCLLH